jgi:tRNA modification GTPase
MPIPSLHDVIVAVATPPGRGGVGVVRVSGAGALAVAARLFYGKRKLHEHPQRLLRGELRDPETAEPFDDALVVYFQNPHSFTGEDVVEFHCHGAPVVLQRVIRLTIRLGARAATPGEFTMRAVLNGRINLTQAEGLRDLIDAQTTYQAQIAVSQMRGALSLRLQPAKERLLSIVVHLESAVEFVEENLDTRSRERLVEEIATLARDVSALCATFQAGHIVRHGLNLAIIGRPNVGKSSLFNALLDADRAIVTDVPGTTRDTLAETVAISDIPVRLVDTAGIRDAADAVERIGVERSYAALEEADLALFVADAQAGVTPEDERLVERLRGRRSLFVVNKIDLAEDVTPFADLLRRRDLNAPLVKVSALAKRGLDEVRSAIWRTASGSLSDARPDLMITDARHAELLGETTAALGCAQASLAAGHSEEVPLADLHRALAALGKITGEVTIEGVFDRIFATFCIGK